MDLEIARKIHFKTTENVATLDGTEELVDSCNCGFHWPCPVLRIYEIFVANIRAIEQYNRLPRVIPKIPAREAVLIWRCCCGRLNDYKAGERQFCTGCRFENPVAEAVYSIDHVKHWPPNIRKSSGR